MAHHFPHWRNLWTGAASSLLPYDYTNSTDVHNKAIVILTDGLNYIQRYQDVASNANPSYTTLIGWNDGAYSSNYNSYRIDHRDYDNTAYGRLMDKWLYKNSNGALIAFNSTATDESTKGPPAYQELNRRLLATCSNIRAKGIKIYLIAFAIDASPVKADAVGNFNTCVGSTGKFYDAVNENELKEAFKDIAAQLVELRLIK